MPIVTPTRLPVFQTLLRIDTTLVAVVVAALAAAGVVAALGPLPVEAMLSCA